MGKNNYSSLSIVYMVIILMLENVNRYVLGAGILVLVIGGGWAAWWLGSPLFIDETADEDLSLYDDVVISTTTITDTSAQTTTETAVGEIVLTLLAEGEFEDADSGHRGSGTVRIISSSTGETTLVFINVDITNGPDLKVYLSAKFTFSGTSDDYGNTFKNLGDLKANIGNFTMDIPSSVDTTRFNSVVIWCEPFNVLFSWATLSTP